MPSQRQSSVHLDAARGLAAVLVMLGHTRDLFFSSMLGGAASATAPMVISGTTVRITMGNEAVMIFFVLSGYLVGGSAIRLIRSGTWAWRDYLIKRLTRLWVVLIPAILIGICLDLAGAHFFGGPNSIYSGPPPQITVPATALSTIHPATVFGNIAFLQGILVKTPGTNGPLWSLAYEFWYYIAFPLGLLALLSRRPVTRMLYAVAFAVVCWFVGIQILMLFPIWILGASLSLLPLRISVNRSKLVVAILGLAVIGAMPLVRNSPLPKYAAQWTIALLFACFVYVVLHRTSPAVDGLYRRCATFLSRISYTLYLVHLPAAVFLCAMVNRPWHPQTKTLAHLVFFFCFNAIIFGFAWLFHALFEANTDRVREFIAPRAESKLEVAV
jgi:peptidoglycan/LPS O-acetylase OafA/YrhL